MMVAAHPMVVAVALGLLGPAALAESEERDRREGCTAGEAAPEADRCPDCPTPDTCGAPAPEERSDLSITSAGHLTLGLDDAQAFGASEAGPVEDDDALATLTEALLGELATR